MVCSVKGKNPVMKGFAVIPVMFFQKHATMKIERGVSHAYV